MAELEQKEGQEQVTTPESKSEDKNSYQKRIDELVSAKKAAEAKALELETKITNDKKAAEEEKLKAEGNYKALMEKVEAERKQEKEGLSKLIKTSYLTALGTKHKIAKPEYLDLFKQEITIEGMEIKNSAEIEKAFEEFKKSNLNLFETDKKVPKTDTKPFTKPDTGATPMSTWEKALSGAQSRIK